MNDLKITIYLLEDGRLVTPYQNEIENLALETMNTHERIYFDKIIVNEELFFKFNREINAWVLHRRLMFEKD
jgi:hypothetical protein